VTQHDHRLDELSVELSTKGFYTFVALPDAVPSLWAMTKFDLVIMTSDVRAEDRARLARIDPPLEPHLLTLDAVEETDMAGRIRARLGS